MKSWAQAPWTWMSKKAAVRVSEEALGAPGSMLTMRPSSRVRTGKSIWPLSVRSLRGVSVVGIDRYSFLGFVVRSRFDAGGG